MFWIAKEIEDFCPQDLRYNFGHKSWIAYEAFDVNEKRKWRLYRWCQRRGLCDGAIIQKIDVNLVHRREDFCPRATFLASISRQFLSEFRDFYDRNEHVFFQIYE